jgi:hypothetical protein
MKRTNVLFLTLTMLLLMLAGTAQANRWDGFEATADCEGWTVDAAAKIGSAHAPYIEIPYLVTLSQDGAVVESFEGTVQAYFQMDADPFSLSESWTTEMSGVYVAEGVFTLPYTTTGDSVMTFVYEFDCGGGQTSACNYTPGYWKNHREAWPVTELDLGGVTYGQPELLRILRKPVRGDATVITAKHLIAAKLNVLNGSDDGIQDAIDAADELLAEHALYSRPSGAAKRELIRVKNALVEYNELGCDSPSDVPVFDKAAKSSNEDSSWSELKSRFR